MVVLPVHRAGKKKGNFRVCMWNEPTWAKGDHQPLYDVLWNLQRLWEHHESLSVAKAKGPGRPHPYHEFVYTSLVAIIRNWTVALPAWKYRFYPRKSLKAAETTSSWQPLWEAREHVTSQWLVAVWHQSTNRRELSKLKKFGDCPPFKSDRLSWRQDLIRRGWLVPNLWQGIAPQERTELQSWETEPRQTKNRIGS